MCKECEAHFATITSEIHELIAKYSDRYNELFNEMINDLDTSTEFTVHLDDDFEPEVVKLIEDNTLHIRKALAASYFLGHYVARGINNDLIGMIYHMGMPPMVQKGFEHAVASNHMSKMSKN